MVDKIITENENNTISDIALNLSGAKINCNNISEEENKLDLSECDNDDSLGLSNSVIPPNTNFNIDGSSDVIVGAVTQFHGPVTIYNNSNNKPLPIHYEDEKYVPNKTAKENTSNTFSTAHLVTSESPAGNHQRDKKWTKKKIFLIILLILTIIALLLFCIFYSLSLYLPPENNNTENGYEQENATRDYPQIEGSSHKLIYRNRWGGRKPLYERPQKVPVKYVIISHSAGTFCESVPECSSQMVLMQSQHVKDGSPDIGYNFVVGGDDNIYVGRGWDNHNFHMNLDTIGINFIGNYVYNTLKPGMIEAANELMEMGVKTGKLDKDYILVAHNQTYNTISPGPNIYRQIKFWPHFSPEVIIDVPDKG